MNKKRMEKNMEKIDHIIGQIPQIEKELLNDPATYGDGCKYLTTLFTNGMRVAKYRQQLCEIRTIGDFPAETMEKVIFSTDKVLAFIMEKLTVTFDAIKNKEEEK